jgi:hypothetical protein
MKEIVRKVGLEQVESGLRNLKHSNALSEIEMEHLNIMFEEFDKIKKLLYTRGVEL